MKLKTHNAKTCSALGVSTATPAQGMHVKEKAVAVMIQADIGASTAAAGAREQ